MGPVEKAHRNREPKATAAVVSGLGWASSGRKWLFAMRSGQGERAGMAAKQRAAVPEDVDALGAKGNPGLFRGGTAVGTRVMGRGRRSRQTPEMVEEPGDGGGAVGPHCTLCESHWQSKTKRRVKDRREIWSEDRLKADPQSLETLRITFGGHCSWACWQIQEWA